MNLEQYTPTSDLLRDRVILVTGAGDGIGRAASLSFARHGATVILVGKTTQKLESVYDEIVADGGAMPAIYPIHFGGAVYKEYHDMAVRLDEEFGRLDGLLQNAAILGPRGPISAVGADSWLEVMQVNLNAPFMLTKALLPLLTAADDASIIFTTSGVGRQGRAYWGPYAASKFGIEGLMQVLADEVEAISNIRVNCLNPGPTDTAMRRQAYPAENPANNSRPAQIMAAYLYLMGPDSRGVHGQSLDAQ